MALRVLELDIPELFVHKRGTGDYSTWRVATNEYEERDVRRQTEPC